MKIEHEGKEIEVVPVDQVQEFVKDQSWYNDTLDSVREKGFNSGKSKWDAEREELIGTYSRELENEKKMNSGKKDQQIEALQEQLQELSTNFKTSQEEAAKLRIQNKVENVKGDLTTQLSGVIDPYDRKNMLRDAMENFDADTGQFKLSTGAMGSVNEVVAELKEAHPKRFQSKQPSGSGINGNPVLDLPSNATDEQRRIARINAKFGK